MPPVRNQTRVNPTMTIAPVSRREDRLNRRFELTVGSGTHLTSLMVEECGAGELSEFEQPCQRIQGLERNDGRYLDRRSRALKALSFPRHATFACK